MDKKINCSSNSITKTPPQTKISTLLHFSEQNNPLKHCSGHSFACFVLLAWLYGKLEAAALLFGHRSMTLTGNGPRLLRLTYPNCLGLEGAEVPVAR